jgi:hypothetical protein
MLDFIQDFEHSYKVLSNADPNNDFPLYYTRESYDIAVADIQEEGSGVLIVNCDSPKVMGLFREFMNKHYQTLYVLDINTCSVSLIVDDDNMLSTHEMSDGSTVCNDFIQEDTECSSIDADEECGDFIQEDTDPSTIDTDEECDDNCKCINCVAEETETNEVICGKNCKCINCLS